MKNKEEIKNKILPMAAAIAIPLLAGGFSALLTSKDMKVYETMSRPPLAPPGWIFPIVWTILYALMGLASYYVYVSEAPKEQKHKALLYFAAQLVMNVFWSTLFFTYERYLISLIWLLIMWFMILICVVRFYRIKRTAGLMMGILLIWTTFAAYLNLSYYIMSITPMKLPA